MKLTWRLPLSLCVFCGICYVLFIFYNQEDFLLFHTSTISNISTTPRQSTVHFTKLLLKKRLKMYVMFESIKELLQKPTKKTSFKPLPTNTNFRLSRLLYQLWDPYSYQNQGAILNCENLVNADEKLYRQGRRFARKLNRKLYEYVNVSDISESIKDSCSPLLNLFNYRKPKHSKASYPIAYTITLDRTAEQSMRMLSSIYRHDNIYCVNPNAKFGIQYVNVFKRLAECVPNIILPEKIYEVRFSTFNKLKGELGCFERLLNVTVPWRYAINLPSSAFPLRNNSMIVKYLRNKPYENVISWDFPTERFMRRVKYSHILKETEGETVLLRTSILKSLPPDNVMIFRKGMHFIGTRDFYTYLTTSSTAKKFLDWVQDTKTPEDFFYASLYRHYFLPYDHLLSDLPPRLRLIADENIANVPDDEVLLALWKSDGTHRCHGQYKGHMCIFGAADLRWLIQQDQLFAHSFDFKIDRVIIDCLTKNLKNPILPDTNYDDNDLPTVSRLVNIF